jgi:hypothetical protein
MGTLRGPWELIAKIMILVWGSGEHFGSKALSLEI